MKQNATGLTDKLGWSWHEIQTIFNIKKILFKPDKSDDGVLKQWPPTFQQNWISK